MIGKVYRKACRVLSDYIARLDPYLISGSLKNPVFVIGSPRGGTSIITDMLNKHPDVADFSEANEIWDQYLDFKRPNWVNPHDDASRWQNGKSDRMRKQIETTFELYRRFTFKKIFMNKCPKNTFRLGTIKNMFPDARLIHIVRDGRAVVSSLSRPDKREEYRLKGEDLPWEDFLRALTRFWIENLEEVEKQKSIFSFDDKQFYEVRYEDYCANPEKHMREMFRFIGISEDQYDYAVLGSIKSQNYKFSKNIDRGLLQEITATMAPQLGKFEYKI